MKRAINECKIKFVKSFEFSSFLRNSLSIHLSSSLFHLSSLHWHINFWFSCLEWLKVNWLQKYCGKWLKFHQHHSYGVCKTFLFRSWSSTNVMIKSLYLSVRFKAKSTFFLEKILLQYICILYVDILCWLLNFLCSLLLTSGKI